VSHDAAKDDFASDTLSVAAVEQDSEVWMSGVGDYSNFAGASDKAKKFVVAFEALAFGPKQDRLNEWRTVVDYNGNGQVSLAELDGYIEKKLKREYGADGLLVWKAFRPSYIRAFMDAKDITADRAIRGTRSLRTDDFVQWSEFRATLHYLCLYALMYDKFAQVDGYGYGGEVGEFEDGKPDPSKLTEGQELVNDKAATA